MATDADNEGDNHHLHHDHRRSQGGQPMFLSPPDPLNPHSLPPNVARPIVVILFYFLLIQAAIGANKAPTY